MSMATNPRTKPSSEDATSAIEDALRRAEDAPEAADAARRTGEVRGGDSPRKAVDLGRRPESPRIPAPPRRAETPRRVADGGVPRRDPGDEDAARVAPAADLDDAPSAQPQARPRAAE